MPATAKSREPRTSALKAPIFTPSHIAIAIFTFVILVVAFAALRMRKPSETALTIRSLAVLPFHVLNAGEIGGPDNYVGLGMADAIITKLGSTARVAVRPTSAVSKYADAMTNPLAAGREQGRGIGSELCEATKPVHRFVCTRSRIRRPEARPQLGVRAGKCRNDLSRSL